MKVVFALTIFSLTFTSFMMSYSKENYRLSRGEELVNSILEETTKIIKSKYKLRPTGAGVSMPGGPIRELSLCFDVKGPLTKEELRRLLLGSANDLLQLVTQNEEIQPYLKYQPFEMQNVGIIIYNNDSLGREVYDPEISVARISCGRLIYKTVDPSDEFEYKNEFEETYVEALETLKNKK